MFTGYFNKVAKHRDRLLVYGQLFELIISQITLKIFLDPYNENFGKLEYDYTKIASNFSIVSKEDSKFNILLKALIDIDWTVEELKDIVISANLTNLTNEKSISEQLHCYINIRDKNVEYAVELSAYELSIKHEKSANELINSFLERRFQPISEPRIPGFIRGECQWWESDFERRVEKYFTEDICQGIDDEAKAQQVTQYAKDIAKLIHNYPDIVESTLNWRFIGDKKL